jgi:signal peptidase I
MSKSRPPAPEKRPARRSAGDAPAAPASGQVHYSRGTRETVESIIVAIILAFLFRSFVAEAFVIPTGSMAPTLQGKHKDVRCAKCNYPYRAGASIEDANASSVVSTTCPNCRFTMELDFENLNHVSFTGDRILVSKFSYDLGQPKRWDVIVFKYPGNAKQNYIKRLVGLPDETLRIRHGDIYVKGPDDDAFRIARKPEAKLLAMLQEVHNSDYVATELRNAGWPSRWQAWSADGEEPVWSEHPDGRGYAARGGAEKPAWLRYQHIVPYYEDWYELENGRGIPSAGQMQGQLITDFYAYNAYSTDNGYGSRNGPGSFQPGSLGQKPDHSVPGMHWVGDLAMECQVEVQGSEGNLLLKLVEGGVHFNCRIDVATGQAELSMEGGPGGFDGDSGSLVQHPTAQTRVRGPGTYTLRMANVDDEVWLWVNNRRVKFSSPTTYTAPKDLRPQWSPQEYGDLAPAGVGTQGVALDVKHLRILRDVYYVATRGGPSSDQHYPRYATEAEAASVFSDPRSWATSELFDWDAAGPVEFQNGADQFFPMGDNSPQSKDARLWEGNPWVERDLLTGKALLIYWPHAWNRPVPFLPNFKRMGFIR